MREAHHQAKDQKIAHLEAAIARFVDRYQNITAAFYKAQAKQVQCMQQCVALQQVVQAKQQLLEVLLLYYPKPLTPEQEHILSLTGELVA